MIFTIPQLYFSFFCGYSGQTVFDDWYVTLYNLVFTAGPLVMRAIFDQDVNYRLGQVGVDFDQLEKNNQGFQETEEDIIDRDLYNKQNEHLKKKIPEIYSIGQDQTIFTTNNFIIWLAQGIVHGVVIFFGIMLAFDQQVLNKDGYNSGLWDFSVTLYTAVVLLADIQLSLYTRFWTLFNHIALFLTSIGFYFAFMLASTSMKTSNAYGTPINLIGTSYFYFSLMMTLGLIVFFDVVIDQLIRMVKQTQWDVLSNFMKFVPMKKKDSSETPSSLFGSFYQAYGQKKNQDDEGPPRTQTNQQNGQVA